MGKHCLGADPGKTYRRCTEILGFIISSQEVRNNWFLVKDTEIYAQKQCNASKKQNRERKTIEKYGLVIKSLLRLNYHSKSVQFIIVVRSTAYHVLIKQSTSEVRENSSQR